jgi:hypothetical protein
VRERPMTRSARTPLHHRSHHRSDQFSGTLQPR